MEYCNLFILDRKKIPTIVNTTSIKVFIDFWSQFYYFWDDEKYFENLKPINELKNENIDELFRWKNGMDLSRKKNDSVNKIKQYFSKYHNQFKENGILEKDLKGIIMTAISELSGPCFSCIF